MHSRHANADEPPLIETRNEDKGREKKAERKSRKARRAECLCLMARTEIGTGLDNGTYATWKGQLGMIKQKKKKTCWGANFPTANGQPCPEARQAQGCQPIDEEGGPFHNYHGRQGLTTEVSEHGLPSPQEGARPSGRDGRIRIK